MMTTTISAITLIWVLGGCLFLAGMAKSGCADQGSLACLAELRKGDPAAIVASVMFMLVWPAVFVVAKLGR